MLKGRGLLVYSVLKVCLYAMGFYEFVNYNKSQTLKTQIILACILVLNSFFRQFYLYKKDKLYKYGQISIVLEFILGAYTASLLPVFPIILFLVPTTFESVAAHSPIFGGSTTVAAMISLMTIDTLSMKKVSDYFSFLMSIFISYGLGFILTYIISYLASLQFRERERIARVNGELEHAYRQLLDNASNLQELSVEKERTRMVREIHDTLAHTLTAVVVQMEACKKLIDIDTSRAKAEIEKAQELTLTGLGDVKRTIKALRPQMLENSSLIDASNNLIRDIGENTHVKVNINGSLPKDLELPSSAEVALFRVIQESITNAIRHGEAEQVDISLTEKDGMINIGICDNGKGCAHIKEGYGLKGITERIKGLNGNESFSSVAGKGFSTQIFILIRGGEAYDNQGDDCR